MFTHGAHAGGAFDDVFRHGFVLIFASYVFGLSALSGHTLQALAASLVVAGSVWRRVAMLGQATVVALGFAVDSSIAFGRNALAEVLPWPFRYWLFGCAVGTKCLPSRVWQ